MASLIIIAGVTTAFGVVFGAFLDDLVSRFAGRTGTRGSLMSAAPGPSTAGRAFARRHQHAPGGAKRGAASRTACQSVGPGACPAVSEALAWKKVRMPIGPLGIGAGGRRQRR